MVPTVTNESITNKEVSWAPTIATVGLSTVGGAIVGGIPGALVGLCASVADEYLIQESHQTKHYLSSTTFWSSTVVYPLLTTCSAFLPVAPLPLYSAASLVAGVAASYFTDDFFDFKERLEIPIDAFCTLNRFFDDRNILSHQEVEKIYSAFKKDPSKAFDLIVEDVTALYQNEFFMLSLKSQSLSLLQVALDTYFLAILAGYGSNFIYTWVVSNKLSSSNLSSLPSKALWEGSSIIGLLALKLGAEFAISSKQTSLMMELCNRVYDKSVGALIEKGNGRKVLATEKGKQIVQFLANDLFTLLFDGVYKLEETLTGITSALYSFRSIINMAPDAFLPYMLTLLPLQKLLAKLGERSKVIAEDYSENKMKLWMTMGDITQNIESINLRDGDDFVKEKYSDLLSKDGKLTKETQFIRMVLRKSKDFASTLHNLSDMLFLGLKVISGELTPAQLTTFKTSMDNIYSFLSSNLQFQLNNKDLMLSKSRIDQFFEIIEAQSATSKVSRSTNAQDRVIFKDYVLRLEGEEIIKIDHFEFDSGKNYAITGKSGCGKTSTLIDLKAGVEGALTSEGEISMYSKGDQQAQVMFLDQNLYLPPESTLLESICFPKVLAELSKDEALEFKQKVLSLFDELEMEPFVEAESTESTLVSNLDSQNFTLSGGQKKKIGIIQAILASPDVLIMDETFTGLDPNSLIKCQTALNHYLPDTLILSVDHHAEDNNYNGFYDSSVNFSEGTIEEMQLSSKSLPTA